MRFGTWILAWCLCLLSPAYSAERPLIGVYYFGVYSPQMFETPSRPLPETVAAEPWWAGVADFRARTGTGFRIWSQKTPEADFDHLQPSIGYYDVRDPKTLEAHIDEATSHGIDYFNFYWYWGASKKTPSESAGLETFRKARNRNAIKYMVSIFAHPWNKDFSISRADTPLVIDELLRLFGDGNYLTLHGRKVITIGDSRGIGGGLVGDVEDFIAALKSRSLAAGFQEPIVLINPALSIWSKVAGADGAQCLVNSPGLIGPGADYAAFTGAMEGYFDQIARLKPLAPCLASNFDERPRQNLFINDAAKIRYFSNQSPGLFYEGLKRLKAWQERQSDPISSLITLYAWNEWHEGGIIEPNARDGFLYVDLIEHAFRTVEIKRYIGPGGETLVTKLELPPPWRRLEGWSIYELPGQYRTAVLACGAKQGAGSVGIESCPADQRSELLGYLTKPDAQASAGGVALYRCIRQGAAFVTADPMCGTQTSNAGRQGQIIGFAAGP